MKNNRNVVDLFLITLVSLCLVLSSCTSNPTLAPTSSPASIPTLVSSNTTTPTVTPVPLPALSLQPGDFYFSVDGTQGMVFSRNPTGRTQEDFNLALDWARQGGSKLLRIHLTAGWEGNPWSTTTGTVNETWAKNWDHFFDQAEADGIWIMPVFGVWFDWNNGTPDFAGSYWHSNPFNQANGGPFKEPGELFQPDSPAQKAWMIWVRTLVERWQGRKNIAAWEIFSEINIASGEPGKTDAKGAVAEPMAEEFTNKVAAMIRTADTNHRPVTLSLAVAAPFTDEWAKFYENNTLDFIEIHPYSAQLDRELVSDVHETLSRYNKPVMIGESGLWEKSAIAPNAWNGVKHAIWAGMVSGAMNARALWGNDGYSFFESDRALALQFMELYKTAELPAVNFAKGVDFAGFKPLMVSYSPGPKIWGAAVGSDKMVLGWFRDAACEPLEWNLQTVISKQTVTLTVPGTAANWRVDFYDTKTGTIIIGSTSVTRQGGTISVPLPDFQDDIVFKIMAQAGTTLTTPAAPGITDVIAGEWNGTISNQAGTFSTLVELSIKIGCERGRICGTFAAPQLPCSGDLFLKNTSAETFVFIEQNVTGATSCISGGYEYLQLLEDGTLFYKFTFTPDSTDTSNGILQRH